MIQTFWRRGGGESRDVGNAERLFDASDLRHSVFKPVLAELLLFDFFELLAHSPTFARSGGTWQQQNPFEIELDAATAIPGNGFLGVEIRQSTLNQHGFFSGRALFFGPSLFFSLSKAIVVKVAWEAQIPAEAGGRVDLVNYERQQVRAQFAWVF